MPTLRSATALGYHISDVIKDERSEGTLILSSELNELLPSSKLTAGEVPSPITPRTAGHNCGQLVMPLHASLTPSSSLLNKRPRLGTVIVPSQDLQALIEKTNSIDSFIKELKEKSIGASSSCTKRLPRELSVSNTCK